MTDKTMHDILRDYRRTKIKGESIDECEVADNFQQLIADADYSTLLRVLDAVRAYGWVS